MKSKSKTINPNAAVLENTRNYRYYSSRLPKVYLDKNEALNDFVKGFFAHKDSNFLKFISMIVDCIDRGNLTDSSFKCFVVKDYMGNKTKIFQEHQMDADECKAMIYKSRQYTSFEYYTSNVGEPFLLYLLNNQDTFKKIVKSTQNRTGWYLNDVWRDISKDWNSHLKYKNDYEENINKSLDATIRYFSKQTQYCPDDIEKEYKYLTALLSLFMEYYIYKNDTEHINKIFEFLHKVGNVKAHSYYTIMNEEDDSDSKAKDRPLLINKGMFYKNDQLYYYYIKFYQTFAGGKYFSSILSTHSIAYNFIQACKLNNHIIRKYRSDNGPLYRELFNSIKDKETFKYETFILIDNMIDDTDLTPADFLDCLEQNFNLLDICLTDKSFAEGHSFGNDMIFNLFTHLTSKVHGNSENGYKDKFQIDSSISKRYFKLISNYLNNCGYSPAKTKTVIKSIIKNTSMEINEFITGVNNYLSDKNKAILLEMYIG